MIKHKFKSRLAKPTGNVSIIPSLLSADFSNLLKSIKAVDKANAGWLQVDVMDGHFVDNISFGPLIVETTRKKTSLPIDAHLMIENPAKFIEPFAVAGADLITVHYEAVTSPLKILKKIKSLGLSCGLALNPKTQVEKIKPFLKVVDLILIMSVNPGFGGQKFMPESIERIKKTRELIKKSRRKIWLQVDGGINSKNIKKAVLAGADSIVAGSAVFDGKNPSKALGKLYKQIV